MAMVDGDGRFISDSIDYRIWVFLGNTRRQIGASALTMIKLWIGLRRLACFALLLTALAMCGCGSEKSITSTVHGTVTYKGKPVAGAVVAFQPVKIDAGLPNRTAQGATDASGRYSLSTINLDDGAVPGEYAVVVFKSARAGSNRRIHEAGGRCNWQQSTGDLR